MASLARQRPPSPAVITAATATDGGGRTWQIVAVRRRPCRPVNLRTAAMASLARQRPPSALACRRCRRRRLVVLDIAVDTLSTLGSLFSSSLL